MSAVMDEEIKRWTARRKSALVLQERGPRTGSGSLKGEERGQVYLISCFFRPSAWAMGRPGRSEASGLRFDHCLEGVRSEEHTSELQSLMRISYAVFCLKKKKNTKQHNKE